MALLGDRGAPVPEGVTREASAPERLALVWGADEVATAVGLLNEVGVITLVVEPQDTPDMVEMSGAPALMLVSADVLDDDAVAALTVVQRLSPHTRVVLLAGDGTTSTGLLKALRLGLSEVVDPADRAALGVLIASELERGSSERVLAVGAHPDDVEIGCGATLLEHRRQGTPVTVLTLSRGAVGGSRDERRNEAVGAAVELSAELLMADLPDTRMEHAHEMVGIIEGVISMVRPTVVYVHSLADNHQDHRAVHAAGVVAARQVPQLLCYQSPSSRNGFSPTKFVPVDHTVHAKVDLLAHFASQSARHYMDPELVVATARYWARQMVGVRYAEPFEVLRST